MRVKLPPSDPSSHGSWANCNPMHGNTIKAPCRLKTRPFHSILLPLVLSIPSAEVRAFFDVHEQEGGVHLEMIAQNMIEYVVGLWMVTSMI
ncbi:hypothetical protein B296_00047720 [Ensete ventricosum]|uniref:Phospho-2-dehydro-3-deoxyheptonate aldolase n=1 Tax=Ensete ventricosum TaxID=4639 RepID=A0A426X4U8_ENSVE|nr:hypothetical protein B296_00047720 [Ensete ventricosum]